MVEREWCDPDPLLDTDVAIGLHLELPTLPLRADDDQRRAASEALERQLDRFSALFRRPPTHLDGHHHCHAAAGIASVVARTAAERGLRVRSVDPRHRRLLRCLGVETPDLLIGRLSENEPVLPPQVQSLPDGLTEWVVHPGYRDERAGSAYDAGREEDLRVLLSLKSAGRADGR